MRRPTDKLIPGIDLHRNNLVIGVINQDGKRIVHRTMECDLKQVTQFLQPFVTGRRAAGFRGHFAIGDGFRTSPPPQFPFQNTERKRMRK